jgi:hypothetical protein
LDTAWDQFIIVIGIGLLRRRHSFVDVLLDAKKRPLSVLRGSRLVPNRPLVNSLRYIVSPGWFSVDSSLVPHADGPGGIGFPSTGAVASYLSFALLSL